MTKALTEDFGNFMYDMRGGTKTISTGGGRRGGDTVKITPQIAPDMRGPIGAGRIIENAVASMRGPSYGQIASGIGASVRANPPTLGEAMRGAVSGAPKGVMGGIASAAGGMATGNMRTGIGSGITRRDVGYHGGGK